MSITAVRPAIRQNPPVATGKAQPVEYCPRHGGYPRDPEVARLKAQAIGYPGVPPERAMALLQRSERLRRTCPGCGGVRPTDAEWLADIRRRGTR